MSTALSRRPAVEMSDDPSFKRRVRRLAVVSSIALGVIWLLSLAWAPTQPALSVAVALGWLTMPTLLALSLRRPWLRYFLPLPVGLVGLPLLAVSLGAVPVAGLGMAGWRLITAGILMGSALGVWFWFRLLPVPVSLDAPFSPGRWALIGVHAALVVAGVLLVLVARFV